MRKFALFLTSALIWSGPAAGQGFIDTMGGNTPRSANSTDLFGGGQPGEQDIEVDLQQRQAALFDDTVSTPEEQEEKGVLVVDYEPYKPVAVKVRNLAETYLFFPEDEVIEDVMLGDGSVFTVDFPRVTPQSQPTRKNVLILSLNKGLVGADTPMTAIGRLRSDGTRRKYLFIVSGWSYRSETISDFFVFIRDEKGDMAAKSSVPGVSRASGNRTAGNQIEKTPEYLREIPFEPTDISFGDYVVKKPSDVSDEEVRKIMPRQIWTDGYWTYLQYGDQQADTMPWVVVRRVVDDVNSPVDYMQHPKKHNVLVVHSVGQNLYLRNGQKRVLCLVWVGSENRPAVMQATFNADVKLEQPEALTTNSPENLSETDTPSDMIESDGL
jgi:type IV secretory pathway VirB9-like protein